MTVATDLSKDDMRRFARLGAMKRLDDIRREEAAIRRAFPELFVDDRATGPRGPKAAKAAKAGTAAKAPKARKRSTMSSAMRQEVSTRMKKYWAGRRKAKNG
ncbi:MAG: hypothetical protein ABI880_01790 [Acidobacteriota bacterium]